MTMRPPARLSGLLRSTLAAALLAGLGACSVLAPPPLPSSDPGPLPTTGVSSLAGQHASGGGVFVPGRSAGLTADTRAFRPGDVLTVVLQESTQASKKADTQFSKGSNAGLTLGHNSTSSSLALGATRDFDGSATSSQQNALQGAITVIVQEVMNNGLLRVAGEKSLTLNQGEELVRVAGYLRADDVDADNRVSSQRIANARISYSGRGALADSNTPGWLTRWFTNPYAPN